MCNNICGRNICVRSKFPYVRSSQDLCACVHMHSLEGTLPPSSSLKRHFTNSHSERIFSILFFALV